jgi:hypothetical protein
MSRKIQSRMVLWVSLVILIQASLLGQSYFSNLTPMADLCVSSGAMVSGSFIKPSHAKESFQYLSLRPGYRKDRLTLSIPSYYTNVNYTLVRQLSRAFPIWNKPFPCYPTEPDWYAVKRQKAPTSRGFFYFKARKAGSSTVAGVALRIARSKAREVGLTPTATNATHCHTRYGHPAAHRLKYYQRDKNHSFLWSIIREPTKRDVSEFMHFAVSRGKLEPSRQAFEAYYSYTPLMQEYYLQFMSTDKPFEMNKDDYVTAVAKIMNEYDFLGITERLDESLVTLQLILNLTTSDILYLSAKTSKGWDDGLSQGQCFYIQPSIVSPQLNNYFKLSQDWYERTRGGNLLYATVNLSLDLTIQSFQKDVFQEALWKYKWALKEAQKRCRHVKFPCSAGGVLNPDHDCVLWDSGCGYDCLDKVALDLNLC